MIANGLQDHWLQGFGHSYRRSFLPAQVTVFLLTYLFAITTRMDRKGATSV